MVLGMDADIGPDERVLPDHSPESRLDQVVEAVVERPNAV